MYSNLKKSLAIGAVLGIVIAASKLDTSIMGIIISLIACMVVGVITTIVIPNRPNLYSLLATLISGLFLCLSYGLKKGVIYTIGVVWFYGILSLKLFKNSGVAFDNMKHLVESFFKNK